MNLTKIICVAFFIACCCILQSYALKCFICNGKEACKKPPLLTCNSTLADASRLFINQYHAGVNTTANSTKFECLTEIMNFTNGVQIDYKSCIYSTQKVCTLGFKPFYLPQQQDCKQCSNKDGCNPAGRVTNDLLTIVTTIVTVVILRFAWK